MARHSKWHNIKHRKGRQDAIRSRQWTKCSRAIMVAARHGGGDPDSNLALRYAIDDAREVNMPRDTIEKAIKKGTGELAGGAEYLPARYEGYAPGGVALIIDCLTDNPTRTAAEIREVFDRGGGKLGVSGSVAFGFTQRGVVTVKDEEVAEEALFEKAVEAGAEDVKRSDDGAAWEVHCAPADLHAVKTGLEAVGLSVESTEIAMIPGMTVRCAGEQAQRVLDLIEAFEELDDVQKVHANCDIADEELARLGAR